MSTREILARLRAYEAPVTMGRDHRADGVRPQARVENSGATATVYLYEEIGGFGVWAMDLVPALAQLRVDTIEVRLNSPGGDYFDGVAIANGLADHPANVVVHVDGLAASAASVIAMAGDEIVMHPGAQMMIHDALTLTYGNGAEHQRTAELLDKVSADIAQLYATRAGGDAAAWREAMRAESWYGADEAVTAGLATSASARELPAPPPTEASWRNVLAAFRAQDISTPASQTSATPAAAVQPDASAPVLPTLSELVCSALTKEA